MKVLNFEEIKNTLVEYIKQHPEIEVANIFGSLAQGRTNALSDIDIALLVDNRQISEDDYRYGYKAEVITDLMKVLKTNHVDLVMLNEAPILLKHRVLYNGRLIYSRNERNALRLRRAPSTNIVTSNT